MDAVAVNRSAGGSPAEKHQKPNRFSAQNGRLSRKVLGIRIPWLDISDIQNIDSSKSRLKDLRTAKHSGDVAFYFHSSGTSSGLPKLIPQTHHGAVGVLPRLQVLPGSCSTPPSTFTTTPLYHGGIADLLRAWSAASPLWLFPEDKAPITGKTVLACSRGIEDFQRREPNLAPPVKYLSCVPYVLQLLSDEPKMAQKLQDMSLVGVGGAALHNDLGDHLVKNGVNLVSRFGSAECGCKLLRIPASIPC